MKCIAPIRVGGFSLIEVVLSVGVIAVMVPIVMAFTVAGGKSSRVASNETRSSLLARTVAHEIRAARSGEGRFIGGPISWPEFPVGGGRLVLSADRNGELLEALSSATYESGVLDPAVAFLIAVRGSEHSLDRGLTISEVVSKVEISIETPPGATAENRRKFVYVELMHQDD